MINPVQGNLPPAATPAKATVANGEPTTSASVEQDRFQAGEEPAIGLPDPSRYPDWKPGQKVDESPRSDASQFPATNEALSGGMDSPCFFNGEVMTRREAIERGLMKG